MPRDPEALELLPKYEELLALRRLHDAGDAQDPRPRMRALASRFPGALRELDALSTPELERRRAEVAIAATGAGPTPTWIGVTARYHADLAGALADRRSSAVPRGSGRVSIDVLAAMARQLGRPFEEIERMVRDASDG